MARHLGQVGQLVQLAQEQGWTVQVVATPSALAFIDVPTLEALTGRQVRSQYRNPGEPKPSRANAIIVAPATFNTINKFAAGISDTYALSILAEGPGLDIPIVLVPFVNSALAERAPLRRNMEALSAEGIRILLGPSLFEPHAVGTGEGQIAAFPWEQALAAVESAVVSE